MKPPDPVSEQLKRVLEGAESSPPSDHLKGQHSERIDVCLAGLLAAHRVLRRDETPCAGHPEVSVGVLVETHDVREAEITEAAMEGGVEHDVAGFDVTVEHHVLMLVVDVVEPRSYIHNDAVAGKVLNLRLSLLAADLLGS